MTITYSTVLDRPVADSPNYSETELPRALTSARTARTWLEKTLVGWGVPVGTVENAALVTSEITTNALIHNAGLGDMVVTAAWWHGHLRVTVSDPDLQVPVLDLADDEHGRGLLIVAGLVTRWGATKTHTGKITFFEMTSEASR